LTNIALREIEVDQVLTWKEMQTSSIDVMCAAGAVPLSYGDMALGYPALFVSAERHGKPLGAKSTPLSMAKTPDSLAFPKRKTPDKSLSLEK